MLSATSLFLAVVLTHCSIQGKRKKAIEKLQKRHFKEVKEGIVDFFNMVLGRGEVTVSFCALSRC